MNDNKSRFECLKEPEMKKENMFKKEPENKDDSRFNLNRFDKREHRNTFKRPNRRYKDDFQYNSFNRKRKDTPQIIKTEKEPKKEFQINESDFPALG